jgi:hypothetical protein
LHTRKITPVIATGEEFVGEGFCKICQLCWCSDFGIAELGDLNPNVMVEIGLMWGFGKHVIFTLHKEYTPIEEVPFDLENLLCVIYGSVKRLGPGLDDKIRYLIHKLD